MFNKISVFLLFICITLFTVGCYEDKTEIGDKIAIKKDGTIVFKSKVIVDNQRRTKYLGVLTDRDGNVYKPNYDEGQVEIYDKNGNLITFFKTKAYPSSIAIAEDATLFVSEAQPAPGEGVYFVVEKFSPEGKLLDNLNRYLNRSQKGIAGLDIDYGWVPVIDIGRDGNIYIVVVEEQRGLSEIRKFDVSRKKWETVYESSMPITAE